MCKQWCEFTCSKALRQAFCQEHSAGKTCSNFMRNEPMMNGGVPCHISQALCSNPHHRKASGAFHPVTSSSYRAASQGLNCSGANAGTEEEEEEWVKRSFTGILSFMYGRCSARCHATAGVDGTAKPYWKGGWGGPRDQRQRRCRAPCTALAAAMAGKAACTFHVGNTIRCSPRTQPSSAL